MKLNATALPSIVALLSLQVLMISTRTFKFKFKFVVDCNAVAVRLNHFRPASFLKPVIASASRRAIADAPTPLAPASP